MILNKRLVLNIFKIFISFVLIIYILFKINLNDTFTAFKNIDIYFFFIAIFIQLFNILIRSYNWKQLLSVHYIQTPIRTLISITFVAAFFNNFLPTLGGDLVRAYEISKLSNQTVKSVSSVILQRLVGFMTMIFFCLIAVIIAFITGFALINNFIELIGSILFISLILFIMIYNIKYLKETKIVKFILNLDTKSIIKKLYYSFDVYKYHKLKFIKIMIIALFAEFIVIIYFYFIALSLHQEINILYFFMLIPIIVIIEILPISINGIGVRESAFLYFFTQIGVLNYIAVSMSLLYYLHKVGISSIGGIIYAMKLRKDRYVNR